MFFSGDTGYFDGYPRIGAEHGPFDALLMAVGAYDPAWHDIHLDPEESVEAAVADGRRAGAADPLVHLRARAASLGRAGWATARRRGHGRGRSHGAQGGATH